MIDQSVLLSLRVNCAVLVAFNILQSSFRLLDCVRVESIKANTGQWSLMSLRMIPDEHWPMSLTKILSIKVIDSIRVGFVMRGKKSEHVVCQ